MDGIVQSICSTARNRLTTMDLLQALTELPALFADYKRATDELAAAQRELAAAQSEKYVPLDWVAAFWSVDGDTARQMIQVLSTGRKGQSDIKVLHYGTKIVRYRKSDIERITESNLIAMKDMLAQKRANKAIRPK